MKIVTLFSLAITLCHSFSVMGGELLAVSPASADEFEMGRRIYVEGRLPSGAPLTASRFGSATISGSQIACVNCHRPSGMGQVEGDIQVPPIAGNFLFANKSDKNLAVMDPRVSKSLNQAHEPYTATSLADAILRGRNNQGREMSVTMPRYSLSEPDLKSLTAYLRQLSVQWSPGVTQNNIRFATVITPDVDPMRRKVLIDMMQAIIHQKNGSTENGMKGRSRHHMTSAAEFVLGTERTWDLDVWELQGDPETWGEQLAERYRSQPVFALMSGASSSTWQPVQDFCDHEKIPCWFPSVDLPEKTPSQYAFYFSGGVMLEANVLARYLLGSDAPPKHLIQVYRDDRVGRAASQELENALKGSLIKVERRELGANSATIDSFQALLKKEKSGDVVVYWLRQDDIALLSKLEPVSGVNNYFSSKLANAELDSLPAKWKANSHLIYLYELPAKREMNLVYFHAWLNMHKFPLIDEVMQSEVFFAMNYMTDTTAEMLNNLYRDYLVERGETMLNKREGNKSEQETRDRFYLGKPGDLIRKHGEFTAKEEVRLPISAQTTGTAISHGTTIYPHLSLGPGQRFASKGGYIVQFANTNDNKLIAESDWIVP